MASHIADLTEQELLSVESEIKDLVNEVAILHNHEMLNVRAVTLQVLLDVLAHAE